MKRNLLPWLALAVFIIAGFYLLNPHRVPASFIKWTNIDQDGSPPTGIEIEHPSNWDARVLGSEGETYLTIKVSDNTDALTLTVGGTGLAKSYLAKEFVFNDSLVSEISYTSHKRAVVGTCNYSVNRESSLKICNQILSSLKIVR